MFYLNSETILNNDRIFSPYIVESYPHQKEKSFNNYLFKNLSQCNIDEHNEYKKYQPYGKQYLSVEA